MANKTSSKSQQAYYARYKATTYEKNRRMRLERALKRNPQNEQIKNALKDINYRRKTPGAHTWSSSEIQVAKIVKYFAGSFDREVFNPNPKVSGPAMSKLSKPKVVEKFDTIQERAMFSMKSRLRIKGDFANTACKSIAGMY